MISRGNGRIESALNRGSVWALLEMILLAAFCLVMSGFQSEGGTLDQISMAYILLKNSTKLDW